MDVVENIRAFSRQPLPHQLLMAWLKDYKRPNDKINELVNQKALLQLKKGFYIAGSAIKTPIPEKMSIANHLLGPSYVSMDSALSYYGLIPERVYETTSVTIKSARAFNTEIGVFSYEFLPLPYYSFGIKSISIGESQQILIASKEKALCDKIIKTKGILLRSEQQAFDYLIDNLRMDESVLKHFDIDDLENWLNDMPKAESISQIIKLIKAL